MTLPEPDAGPVGSITGLAGGKGLLKPVRSPFPNISVHIKKAPWVGGILHDITGFLKVISILSSTIPVIIHIRTCNGVPPRIVEKFLHGRHIPIGILCEEHYSNPQASYPSVDR